MMKKLAITVAVSATFGMGVAQADNLQIEPLNPFLAFNIVTPANGTFQRSTGIYEVANGAESFLAYCIELLEPVKALALTGDLDFTAVSLDSYITDPTAGGNDAIQTLFDQRLPTVDTGNLLHNSIMQLAIWGITVGDLALTDWAGASLDPILAAQETEALDSARAWLGDLDDPTPGVNTYDLTAWVHSDTPGADDGSQDMLQFARITNGTVPEPGSLLLGLAGLAGLGFARRMR